MNEKIELELAHIFSELRMLDFSELEIQELKAMSHNLPFLKTYLELHKGISKMESEDIEDAIGIKRNAD